MSGVRPVITFIDLQTYSRGQRNSGIDLQGCREAKTVGKNWFSFIKSTAKVSIIFFLQSGKLDNMFVHAIPYRHF